LSVATDRQDALLLKIADADEAASGVFLTAGAWGESGTTLFHDGFGPPAHQIQVEMGDIQALIAQGSLQVTAYRSGDDVSFVLSPAGRVSADRLRTTGPTELEMERERTEQERQRADRAEQGLREERAASADADAALQARRERLAWQIAWFPAFVVAVVIGVVAYNLGEQSGLSAFIGILFAIGLSGASFVPVVRRAIARGLVRLLKRIHELT
jgi:hypothetical protein